MSPGTSSAEMPFLDHLEELRWRIIWSLAALIIGVVGAFILLQRFDIFKFLEGPILPYLAGNKLKYTHPGDPLSVLITASFSICLLYTSDAADERSSVDLGGRRIIKKKKKL